MKKILFIIGSLRAKSFNRQVANEVKEIIGNRAKLTELLTFIKADVLPEQVGIAVPAEAQTSLFLQTNKKRS